jgi:pimeloyl-ACP methyl ester carboxylesterase
MLDALPVRTRRIEIRGGHSLHVVEAGGGEPAVFLHGSNTSSLSFGPLLAHLEGVHAIAVDRPGQGLSDPAPVPRRRVRDAAVRFLDDFLDAMGLDAASFVGQSGGGVWTLWYAMARPERVRSIVLLGSVPFLPGTRCPAPMRVMATPVLGATLARLIKPTPRSFVRFLSSVGEGETVVRYPDFVEAQVAAGSDPVARTTNLAEIRASISPFGFRRSALFRAEDLRSISAPTLFIWGDQDPVGSVEVARDVVRLLPDARLEVLPAGHVPQLGHPQRVAAMVSGHLHGADR